jgi:hypothetical protein
MWKSRWRPRLKACYQLPYKNRLYVDHVQTNCNLITYLIITIWHNLIVVCKFLVQLNISEFNISMATCSYSLCLCSEFTNLQCEFVSISCKCEWNLYWTKLHLLLMNLYNWLTNHLSILIPKLPCQSLKP